MILQIKTEKELILMVQSFKKEIDDLKLQVKTLSKKTETKPDVSITPLVKGTSESLTSNDVLSIIDSRVTMLYINKLYKKGAK